MHLSSFCRRKGRYASWRGRPCPPLLYGTLKKDRFRSFWNSVFKIFSCQAPREHQRFLQEEEVDSLLRMRQKINSPDRLQRSPQILFCQFLGVSRDEFVLFIIFLLQCACDESCNDRHHNRFFELSDFPMGITSFINHSKMKWEVQLGIGKPGQKERRTL